MRLGDDMTMRVRLKHERNSPRERAAEERHERGQEKKRRRSMRNLRRARMARGRLGPKRKRRGPRLSKEYAAKFKIAKYAARAAALSARLVPYLGWALLVNDAALLYHEFGRRISGGMSARLVQAQDSAITMGDYLPQAASAAAAIDYVESDPARLRAIGEDDRMSSTLLSNLVIIRQLAYESAVGADMIRTNQHFDSADSFLDKIIMQAERAELKSMADRTCHLIRTERSAKGKGK